jgi:hypothetical protein
LKGIWIVIGSYVLVRSIRNAIPGVIPRVTIYYEMLETPNITAGAVHRKIFEAYDPAAFA